MRMAGRMEGRWLRLVSLGACLIGWAVAGSAAEQKPVRHVLAPYHRDQTCFRWLDIADNPYSEAFRRRFRYREGQVVVTYTTTEGDTLRGTLVARGLKPNFAYQLKLEGRPSPPGIADAPKPANWANEQLGSVGRWWCLEDASNTWVSSYARSTPSYQDSTPSYGRGGTSSMDPFDGYGDTGYSNRGSYYAYGSYHEGHTLLGYLIFDFFVTDANGNARHEFTVDSSYHVLWKTSQSPPGFDDGPTRTFSVRGERGPFYERVISPTRVAIYPEQEYGRPEPGQLRLPPGKYRCRLLLTEESFHASGWGSKQNLGGHWAHALSDENLEFTIVSPAD